MGEQLQRTLVSTRGNLPHHAGQLARVVRGAVVGGERLTRRNAAQCVKRRSAWLNFQHHIGHAGQLPPTEDDVVRYLKIPLNVLPTVHKG